MSRARVTSIDHSSTLTDVPPLDASTDTPSTTEPVRGEAVSLAPRSLTQQHFEEFLVEHAVRRIWGNPYDDRQYIIELNQLTRPTGAYDKVEIFNREIMLPTDRETYHIYMIGGHYPYRFGLPDENDLWFNIKNWAEQTDFVLKAYNADGVIIPLEYIYFAKEYDDNLLIAIKQYPNTGGIRFGHEPIYFHFKNNQYWDHVVQSNRIPYKRKHYHQLVDRNKDQQGILTFLEQNQLPYTTRSIYVNGHLRHGTKEIEENDTIDIRMDNGIMFTEYHRVDDLQTYQSRLDKMNKYLLSLYDRTYHNNDWLEGKVDYGSLIHYRDDIEIHLLKIEDVDPTVDLTLMGQKRIAHEIESKKVVASTYYHRNEENSVRHVTHQSYGLPVDYVQGYIRKLDPEADLSKWYLKVSVRTPRVLKHITPERNRVIDLHKLPRDKRIQLLTSTDSTMDIWKARELEMSMYNFLMRCFPDEITPARVYEAYGYDYASGVLANPNVAITRSNELNYFNIPVGVADKATVFEYDENGLLLGWYHHTESFRYLPVNDNTRFIEVLSGYGTNDPSYYIDPVSVTRDPLYHIRAYRSDPSVEEGKFKDITKASGIYTTDNQVVTFANNTEAGITNVVITDERFLCRNMTLTDEGKGYYRFTLVHGPFHSVLPVPYGRLDVWLDGHSLVEGIDYHIDGVSVTIVSKQYLRWNEETQRNHDINITYRATGFPEEVDGELRFIKPREVGFTVNNKLSVDNDVFLHQHRVSRYVVDGGTFHPDVATYNHYGEVTVEEVENGRPYMINDYYIALRGFAGHTRTYAGREEDYAIRKAVQDFTSEFFKDEIVIPDKVTMKQRYPVYSPFLSAVIDKLIRNQGRYRTFDYHNKMKIRRLVEPYTYLLKTDPASIGYDRDFVICHPVSRLPNGEPQVISHRLYATIQQVINTYLQHPVELEPWFKVTRTRDEEATS